MLCERCQNNEASVHLSRIINGKKEEIHLCEKCARESSTLNSDQNNLSFQSLLSGILNNNFSANNSSISEKNRSSELKCSNCGLNYKEFTQKGLFGCALCFESFDEKLDDLFKRIHGATRHTGKKPLSFAEKMDFKTEIRQLKSEMKTAVEKENFEKAAELRDEIHAIKQNMEEDENEKSDK